MGRLGEATMAIAAWVSVEILGLAITPVIPPPPPLAILVGPVPTTYVVDSMIVVV